MSVIRKNPITHDWVIFAPNRAHRPIELARPEEDRIALLAARPLKSEVCPFCPGREEASEEVERTPSGPDWRVRVIANKYSSVDRAIRPERRRQGLHQEMDGFGIHDVIVDCPEHNTTWALMSPAQLALLWKTYRRRTLELQSHPDVRHVVVFKNQGFRAGGSLEHPHSQIYGLPVVPFETQVRLREMERWHDINDGCLLCALLAEERAEGSRIIAERPGFVALTPYADLSPYHFWIIPTRHRPSLGLASDGELEELADLCQEVFWRLFQALGNPDFNLVVQSLTRYEREEPYFHWYVSVIPQVKTKGGLEYAGGLYVNPVLPETAAAELRAAGPPSAEADSAGAFHKAPKSLGKI